MAKETLGQADRPIYLVSDSVSSKHTSPASKARILWSCMLSPSVKYAVKIHSESSKAFP